MVKRHRRQNAGGMPLSFLDSSYKEPSALSGSNHNISEVGLARPVLNHTGGSRHKSSKASRVNRKRSTKKNRSNRSCRTCKKVGGFYPSVMGSLVRNAQALMPAVGITGYRMLNNFGKTKKNRY
jgi:hypothetical protein